MAELTPNDLAMFARLGIGAELLARARVERVTDTEAREKFGIKGNGDMSGLAFPYFDAGGVRRTCRVRRDNPEIEAGRVKRKYVAPYGDSRHLYIVPGSSELGRDADIPVVLVEAEKSGLALTAWAERTGTKLLPLALGGCWGWRGRIGKAETPGGHLADELGALPELGICGKGRRTYVLLDANAATSVKVQQARTALAMQLRKQGADVRILELPAADGVNGPDDYIGVCGDEAMAGLFDGTAAGAAVLDDVVAFIRRFMVLSDSEAIAIALWCAHTYCFSLAPWTPYLAVSSPAKQSGKSRLLEVLHYVVRRPWSTSAASAAALYRKIDVEQPCLLLDETDALFKGDPEIAQAIRGILNAGAHYTGAVSRCVGQGTDQAPRNFKVFCPKALAGIGYSLPDTVQDRSLPIRLQRKLTSQKVERLRDRKIRAGADALRDRLAEWVGAQLGGMRDAEPHLPEELTDRQQDGAEILLMVADAAGGDWPAQARRVLLEIYASPGAEDQDVRVRLLADIKTIFDEAGADRMASAELIAKLLEIETSPWSEWNHGKPMAPAGLSRQLKPYEIFPRTVRLGDKTPKGYLRESFEDAWQRYLPPLPLPPEFDPQHPAQCSIDAGQTHFFEPTQEAPVSDGKSEESSIKTRVVAGVAVQNPGEGEKEGNVWIEGSL